MPLDISIPRRESTRGLGDGGFFDFSDPRMPPEEAAFRRDFTMNAMAFDPLTEELIDPFGGRRDIELGVLRHTSPAFSEDPLRVLRGMQFAARFLLTGAPETIAVCQSLRMDGLPPERVFEEWRKLLLRGSKPSYGLCFLRECGWLTGFPELEALLGCEQEAEWHPEGDVWTHTLLCLDAFAAGRVGDAWEDLVVGLAVLCHDMGKPATTQRERGKVRSLGHEEAGEGPTRSFLARLTNSSDLSGAVVPLVTNHLKPLQLYEASAGDSAIRRLARRVRRIDRLVRVAEADRAGRHLEADGFPAGTWLLSRAEALEVASSAPSPIVLGRHLIELGLQPGPDFGPVLAACYEAQLDGVFSTLADGKRYALQWLTTDRAARSRSEGHEQAE